ncbi:MAG: hypothetical protein PHU25_11895 [Deltaproteobacteria bacterium]|nr:hypothetical protein [Deltaproteobacteria bacterium]
MRPFLTFALFLAVSLPLGAGADDSAAKPADKTGKESASHWRDDPSVLRHPGSYIGGGGGVVRSYAWLPAKKGTGNVSFAGEHDALAFGPLWGWQAFVRVGDAFMEWLAIGFQIDITSASGNKQTIAAFDLMLDVSFFPWEGLGIRPSVGLGFGYAQGEQSWQFGGGGPATLSLAVLYEIRMTRFFVIAPVVQAYWITGQEYDAVVIFAGIELIKWFATATG